MAYPEAFTPYSRCPFAWQGNATLIRLQERAGSTFSWENRSSCCSVVPLQGRRFTCVVCFYRAPWHGSWFSELSWQVELLAGPERAVQHSPRGRRHACVFSGLGGETEMRKHHFLDRSSESKRRLSSVCQKRSLQLSRQLQVAPSHWKQNHDPLAATF